MSSPPAAPQGDAPLKTRFGFLRAKPARLSPRLRFFHSIRFRLSLWFSLVLGVVLVAFGVFVYLREAQSVRSDAASRLAMRVRQYEEIVLRPLRGEGSEDGGKTYFVLPLASQSQMSEGEFGATLDADGNVIEMAGGVTQQQAVQLANAAIPLFKSPGVNHPGPSLPERFFNTRLGQRAYLVAAVVIPGGQNTNLLFLLGAPVDAQERMPRLFVTLLLGGAATLLLAIGGGFWLAGRALKPVKTITQAAQSISENDLSRRLNLNTRDELGDLARTFDGMLERLQAAFDRQRRFTADASHELRTPLAIITLESQRALENKRSSGEYRQALEIVRSESGFMSHLVEEMLTLARMDSGRERFSRENLDLSDAAVDAVERLTPLARTRGIQLRVGELPELPILGDRAALGQMIGNLVDNALKYTPSGPQAWVLVETGEYADGSRLAWLRVSDSGPGVPPEALPHLFERFYRADAARSHNVEAEGEDIPGSGLGLSIVQRVAELHGGSVRAWNLPAGGAAFEVNLPLR